MRIAHVNYSDVSGGATRAAYRVHRALCSQGADSTFLVNEALSGDWTVRGPRTSADRLRAKLRPQLDLLFRASFRTANPVIHSAAAFSSSLRKKINSSDFDIVNLHWVHGEMLSVADIGKLSKPVFWTLHDMWAFCGAEHYTTDFRWKEGYNSGNRPNGESGFDINRWVWKRKLKHWNKPINIITPSTWLAECARKSVVMNGWPVFEIPYALDTEIWAPINRNLARELLRLPEDVPLLLFGAIGGSKDPRKGFDLLQQALRHLEGEISGLELVVFGQMAPKEPDDSGFPIHYAGFLHDDISLRLLYSAANAMVLSSRQDNLPNTGLEAQACGTPVVAFDVGGMPNIVRHKKTGYLAKPFDVIELAEGIKWTLKQEDADPPQEEIGSADISSAGTNSTEKPQAEDSDETGWRLAGDLGWLGMNARRRAVERYAYANVAERYLSVYKSVLD